MGIFPLLSYQMEHVNGGNTVCRTAVVVCPQQSLLVEDVRGGSMANTYDSRIRYDNGVEIRNVRGADLQPTDSKLTELFVISMVFGFIIITV